MKLVEQLTLITLQTAHHGLTPPRFASTERNHGLRPVSTDFCNKIGQKQTSFDQVVRAGKQRQRYSEADRFSGLEINNQLEFGRPLDRQIGGLFAFEDTMRIGGCLSELILQIWAVRQKTPRLDVLRRWKTVGSLACWASSAIISAF